MRTKKDRERDRTDSDRRYTEIKRRDRRDTEIERDR
jgi:hypothetical protein